MILSKQEGWDFFPLLDKLTIYAHTRLAVVDDATFFDDTAPRGISEIGQRETLNELWDNQGLIDSFLQEASQELSENERNLVQSWKNAYRDTFFIDYGPDGVLYFLSNEYIFEVCGLSKEIKSMLHNIPTTAATTLLPFKDHVVYAMFLAEMPLYFSDSILDILQAGIREALDTGRVISDGETFMRMVPQIKENEIQRQVGEMFEELELDQAADGQAEGQHRGVLADLLPEDREQAIEEHYHNLSNNEELDDSQDEEWTPADELASLCCKGPVVTSLEELAAYDSFLNTNELAKTIETLTFEDLGLEDTEDSEMQQRLDALKAAFIQESSTAWSAEDTFKILSDPDKLITRLVNLPIFHVTALRTLADYGGRMSIPKDDYEALYDAPQPTVGLCYLFDDTNSFEFVMPDEMVPVIKNLDWDEYHWRSRRKINLIRFFDAVVELRGATPYADAIDEYAALFPDDFETAQDIHDALEHLILHENFGINILDTKDDAYLLHEDLAWLYLDRKGLDPYEDGGIFEGELDEMLEGLFTMQESKDPRPVVPEMVGDSSIHYWRSDLPAIRALLSYLDAHVPDTQDDYDFADDVMLEVEEMLRWGFRTEMIEHFFDMLEEHDFIPNEAQMRKLLDLFMNAANSYPSWSNNGWAASELVEKTIGRKMFYNEDGSIMKVGRNDPCPCGSGKKYKKCCGR